MVALNITDANSAGWQKVNHILKVVKEVTVLDFDDWYEIKHFPLK